MKRTNTYIVLIFALQLTIASICAVVGTVWSTTHADASYLQMDSTLSTFGLFFQKVGTWILIFTNFIPISLLVSLELVKFYQAYFMRWDILMFDKLLNKPMQTHTSNLNEELGEIDMVFSDKTGTLTQNVMKFKKFSTSIGSYNAGSLVDSFKSSKKVTVDNLDTNLAKIRYDRGL